MTILIIAFCRKRIKYLQTWLPPQKVPINNIETNSKEIKRKEKIRKKLA